MCIIIYGCDVINDDSNINLITTTPTTTPTAGTWCRRGVEKRRAVTTAGRQEQQRRSASNPKIANKHMIGGFPWAV